MSNNFVGSKDFDAKLRPGLIVAENCLLLLDELRTFAENKLRSKSKMAPG